MLAERLPLRAATAVPFYARGSCAVRCRGIVELGVRVWSQNRLAGTGASIGIRVVWCAQVSRMRRAVDEGGGGVWAWAWAWGVGRESSASAVQATG